MCPTITCLCPTNDNVYINTKWRYFLVKIYIFYFEDRKLFQLLDTTLKENTNTNIMSLIKCPTCGSEFEDSSSIWPKPRSLPHYISHWKVRWRAEKPLTYKCCVICATVISVISHIEEKSGSVIDCSRDDLKVHSMTPGQPPLLTLYPTFLLPHKTSSFNKVALIMNLGVGTPPRETSQLWREISVNGGSQETLGLAKNWLDICKAQHPNCNIQEGHYVPSRLLDVDQDGVKLVLREDLKGFQDGIQYVALSHCWGRSQPLKTTEKNMRTHTKGIPFGSLPATFKDAIKVVRSLGLRYVWIDSLCIIQDNKDDWEQESEQMGMVYGHAELVLAASSASSSNDGFLQARRCMKTDHVRFNPHDLNVSLNLKDGESDFNVDSGSIQCDYRIISEQDHEEKLPLDKRAWPYQERLLATRYLSFRHDEILFECSKGTHCECGWAVARHNFVHYTKNLRNMLEYETKMERYRVWEDIVGDYCHRELTMRSDKLVALSAVASKLQTKFGDTYLAGLWGKNFVRELLWMVAFYGHTPVSDVSSPEPYYAPSWSWTSVDARDIYFPHTFLGDDLLLIHLNEASTIPSTPNRFGPVSSGFIRLQGRPIQSTLHIFPPGLFKRFKLFLYPINPKYRGRWIKFPTTALKLESLHLDLLLTVSGSVPDHTSRGTMMSARRINYGEKDSMQESPAKYSVLVLPIMADRDKTHILVLGPSLKQPGCYERLGYGALKNPRGGPSEMKDYICTKFEIQELTLV
ncbi:heterokaryon incompatibility protein-domain-containing protein [Annulohypoxylon nitens]|nr:heterokaryon incompatibility protein-domain-containing protein [Annulohypoxylon nitens]